MTAYKAPRNDRTVQRWFSLFLLIGALVGLFGQEMAFATSPAQPMHEQSSATSSMSAECAEMMDQDQQSPAGPCKGMSLECIAKMGCATPAALLPAVPANAGTKLWQPALIRTLATPMYGRSDSPELRPPSQLG